MESVYKYMDGQKSEYIKRLSDFVAIPSVSAEAGRRAETIKSVEYMKARLDDLGVKTRLVDLGTQQHPDVADPIPLPPALLGELGSDPKKKTLCVYGHLDVQPAHKDDGWNTEPFVLTEVDGQLFGRGSTDDKGPVLGWVNAIEAFQKNKVDIPVNLKFIFEGMEESGSEGLEELCKKEEKSFFGNVDWVCISDNYWLGKEKPCITYGLRGIAYFSVEISGPKKDLHSGVFGGSVHEPMQDIIALMASLTTKDGKIAVKGVYDDVEALSEVEKGLYPAIEFDVNEYRNDIGVKKLRFADKPGVLMSRWRYPALTIHDIGGGSVKTIVAAKVSAKFSIRLVPDQDAQKIEKQITQHLQNELKSRGSPNALKVVMTHGVPAWRSDPTHENYEAGKRATKSVYGVEPDMTREGGSIPITLTFSGLNGGTNVMLLPMGASDDGAHSQNEKINIRNYVEGSKLLAAYIYEAGQIGK